MKTRRYYRIKSDGGVFQVSLWKQTGNVRMSWVQKSPVISCPSADEAFSIGEKWIKYGKPSL